jgi:hypothetical protein
MKHRRSSSFRAVGASMLAALALTALTASSAQASGNGLFLINLTTIASFPKTISSTAGTATLLAWGLDIECLSAEFTGNITAAAHGVGKITFKECQPPAGVCLVTDKEITTSTLLLELLLLGTILRLKSSSGPLASVTFLSQEEECLLIEGHEETLPVQGEACAEVAGDTLKFIGAKKSTHCPNGMSCGPQAVNLDPPSSVLVQSGGSKVTTHA